MTTSAEIIQALRVNHPQPEWIFFPEIRMGTGYGGKWEQRIDAWALNCYPSKGLQSISYEIKVSRSDFLREIANPKKRVSAMEVSNLFYFVSPVGMIKEEELPDDCGLMEVADGRINTVHSAGFRDRKPLEWRFLASLGRRIVVDGNQADSLL